MNEMKPNEWNEMNGNWGEIASKLGWNWADLGGIEEKLGEVGKIEGKLRENIDKGLAKNWVKILKISKIQIEIEIEWTNKWMNEWMNERTNEWMNEWMNKWMNEWTKETMNERMNEQ